jgi:hypothetical protein
MPKRQSDNWYNTAGKKIKLIAIRWVMIGWKAQNPRKAHKLEMSYTENP